MAVATASSEIQAQWKDPKKYLWLLAPALPIIAPIAWILARTTHLGFFWWTGPIVLFFLVPLLDQSIGRDESNPPEEVVPALEQVKYYRYITYAWIPMQYAALIWSCWLFTKEPNVVCRRLLWMLHFPCSARSNRSHSNFQPDLMPPRTVLGKNRQKLSPNLEDAGS